MVACVLLEVLVEDLVAGSHHDGRPQLGRSAAGLALAMTARERPEAGRELARLQQRGRSYGGGPDDVGGGAVLIQQDGERDSLVLDEGLGVPLATGADRRDTCTRGQDLFVSVADLTGPLAARQSAEVAEEEDDLGLFGPQVTEPVLTLIGVDQDLVGELGGIERHRASVWRWAKDTAWPFRRRLAAVRTSRAIRVTPSMEDVLIRSHEEHPMDTHSADGITTSTWEVEGTEYRIVTPTNRPVSADRQIAALMALLECSELEASHALRIIMEDGEFITSV